MDYATIHPTVSKGSRKEKHTSVNIWAFSTCRFMILRIDSALSLDCVHWNRRCAPQANRSKYASASARIALWLSTWWISNSQCGWQRFRRWSLVKPWWLAPWGPSSPAVPMRGSRMNLIWAGSRNSGWIFVEIHLFWMDLNGLWGFKRVFMCFSCLAYPVDYDPNWLIRG